MPSLVSPESYCVSYPVTPAAMPQTVEQDYRQDGESDGIWFPLPFVLFLFVTLDDLCFFFFMIVIIQ